MANNNGTILNRTPAQQKEAGQFDEIGTSGLDATNGYVFQAYHTELQWPQVYPLYKRIWRNDAEVSGIVRPNYVTFARSQRITVTPPQDPSDDDLRLAEYTEQMFDELEGGQGNFIETVQRSAFFGWVWFNVAWGLRNGNDFDGWQSQYTDGLPTVRKLAHRDHSSFVRWLMDDGTGKLHGLIQNDPPNTEVTIPIDRSLHLTFGDPTSPEGLSPLEAVWRLERMKYNLEMIYGIGAQHTAGHLDITSEKAISDKDKPIVKAAARAIMSPQEGNVAAWPPDVKGSIMDSAFSAADSLHSMIRMLSLQKLQVYSMEHVAMASTSGQGSFAARSDASESAVAFYNGFMDGQLSQVNAQLGKQVFENEQIMSAFPGVTAKPTIGITPVEKTIPLTELSAFVTQLAPIVPMGDDDLIAIRKKSGFLSESLPDLDKDETGAVSSGTPQATVTGISTIIDKVRSGDMTEVVAVETMIFIGLPRSVAEKLVAEALTQAPINNDEPTPASDDADMSVQSWWQLRSDIYADRKLPQDTLIDMLDNATTDSELDNIRVEMSKHG